MVAFVPNIVGAVVPTSWSVLWLATPILLFKTEIKLTISHVLGLLFLGYAALSCLWSPHGTLYLLQLLALAGVFLWAATLSDLRKVVIGLSIGLYVAAFIASLQYFGYNDIVFQATPKMSGLYVNSNIFSEITGMLLILILIYRLWWFVPAAIPGVLIISRASIVAFGLTFVVWLWSKSKSLAIFVMLLALLIAVATTQTFNNFTSDRIELWRDTISGITLFGHGAGSFVYDFPIYSSHFNISYSRPFDAHNDLLQLIFEFGIGAIPLILMMIVLLRINNVHKYPLIFFLVIGTFGFPFHVPNTAFMAALLAGYLAQYSMDYSRVSDSLRSVLFKRVVA